jgi:HPt (histidine-containing phosphotransfer) domain-containing protein
MDLQMPEMDGYTATRQLRADARFHELPIVAMTAHALVEERQRCLEAGMNDHLTKPIDPDAVFTALRRWVRAPESKAPKPIPTQASLTPAINLPAIEGVDLGDGLKRLAGNTRLYRNLLEQFCEKQATVAQQTREALEGGDRTFAERLAHTLKGVAGNLGITGVQKAAARLELGIRNGDSTVSQLLEELESAMTPQIVAIRNALASLPESTAPIAAAEFDQAAAAGAIARLKALIDRNDGDAADAVESVAQALAGTVGAQHLATLRAAIYDYDFQKAAAELTEIERATVSAVTALAEPWKWTATSVTSSS